MKKFLAVTAFSVISFLTAQINFCHAKMPPDEMCLGGIGYGTSTDKLFELHGEPEANYRGYETSATYVYGGENLILIHYNRETKKIHGLHTLKNVDWTTPAGIGIGSNISDAVKLYGEPDIKKVGKTKTAYCYAHEKYDDILKRYVRDFGFFIGVDNASGKIVELEIGGDTAYTSFEEVIAGTLSDMIIPVSEE